MSTDSTTSEQTTTNPNPTPTPTRVIQSTINVQPLIQEFSEEVASITVRDLALFFHQLEVAADNFEKIENANYHPVAGRYFKVSEQHERNTSWLNRGKKEALLDITKSLKVKFSLDQRVQLEQAGGALRKELFDLRNEQETAERIRQVLSEAAQ